MAIAILAEVPGYRAGLVIDANAPVKRVEIDPCGAVFVAQALCNELAGRSLGEQFQHFFLGLRNYRRRTVVFVFHMKLCPLDSAPIS